MLDMDGIERSKEEGREMRKVNWVHDLLQDSRFAVRQFRRNPGFTLITVLTLALGLGANTTIYSAAHAVLLDPLPFHQPDRVVILTENRPGMETDLVSPITFDDWSTRSELFEELAAFRFWENRSLRVNASEPEPVNHVTTTENYFAAIGVTPLLGRTYGQFESTGVNEAVLSFELWRKRFAGDPGTLGRLIRINETPFTVVGVLPPLPREVTAGIGDVWTPLRMYDVAVRRANSFRARYLRVVGRLKPGIAVAQAQERMSLLQEQLALETTSVARGYSVGVESLHDALGGRFQSIFLILFGAAGFVLFAVCANVTNLMLSRGMSREKEVSIRMALGASRSRIARGFLAENLLLCVLGAAVGLAFAGGGLSPLKYLLVARIPRLAAASISLPVLAFALAATVVCIAVVCLGTSMGLSRGNLHDSLKESGRASSSGTRQKFLRRALTMSEVVFAVLLMAGSALLLKSFANLMKIEPGFVLDNRVVVDVVLPDSQFNDGAKRMTFYREMFRQLGETPGVDSTGASTYFPFRLKFWLSSIWREGIEVPEGEEPIAYWNSYAGDYFAAMGIPLLRGRLPAREELWEDRGVIVVNEQFGKRLFPALDPLGRRVKLGKNAKWLTIIGVVGDVRQKKLYEEPRPEFYVPVVEEPLPFFTLVVNTRLPAETAGPRIRSVLMGLSPTIALHNMVALKELARETIAIHRAAMLLLLLFAGLALLLAAIGIYGVVSYMVEQQFREFGIRMALGASPAGIIRFITIGNLRITALGVAVGLITALAVNQVLQVLLFEVGLLDGSVYALVASITVLISFVASWIPARRAAKVDPMVALRRE
jgi:putative ABC transport system permease protein